MLRTRPVTGAGGLHAGRPPGASAAHSHQGGWHPWGASCGFQGVGGEDRDRKGRGGGPEMAGDLFGAQEFDVCFLGVRVLKHNLLDFSLL